MPRITGVGDWKHKPLTLPPEETVAERVRRQMPDENPEALFADGFDDAIVGIARRCGQPSLVAYSYAKGIAVLMADDMTYDDAVEWMEFNVVGAWMGENTPVWIDDSDVHMPMG